MDKLNAGDIYIDDNPSDYSDAIEMTDEEYNNWIAQRKNEVEEEVKKGILD